MDKDIKQYLHYYLGCEIDTGTGYVTLIAVQKEVIPCADFRVIVLNGNVIHELHCDDKCKLVLRKLESMTEGEWQEIRFHLSADIVAAVPIIKWQDRPRWVVVLENRIQTNTLKFLDGIELIKRGFDLFGLIDAGLALDKATIK